MKLSFILAILFIALNIETFAQKEDRIWIFGDHAGIDFNNISNPVSFYSGHNGDNAKRMYASIADSAGQLCLYAVGDSTSLHGVRVYNRFDSLILNGDGIIGHPNYSQAILLLPLAENDSIYYLFTIGEKDSNITKLYYNIINLAANSGKGEVVLKNEPIVFDSLNLRLTTVRHANGRDWWIIGQVHWTNEYYKLLLTPYGLLGPTYQSIGSPPNRQFYLGNMVFSRSGTRLASVGLYSANIELFEFNRCTGMLSNYIGFGEGVFSPENSYMGVAFSPNENYLYVTNSYTNPYKYVYQFDLNQFPIQSSKTVIQMYADTGLLQYVAYDDLLLGHDDKIYVSKGNGSGPNSSTIFTHNMDVILNPDFPGSACNYSVAYFPLGMGRTTYGLPNMPNFQLGSVIGSFCDSLNVGMLEVKVSETIKVYPQPATVELNIVSEDRTMSSIILTDLQGKVSKEWQVNRKQERLLLDNIPAGMYIMNIETDKETIRKKVVIVK